MASISVWGKPLTEEGWANGDLLRALSGGSRNAFTPFTPPPIPSGYYDPNLDAQRQAASRGLTNTEQDVGTALRREGEDYGTNVALLTRNYKNLATRQQEQQNQYGVIAGGGAALQSAAKRAANQLVDQTALDTTHNRAVADAGNALTRARSEDVFYGQDVDQQKNFQAQQAGYTAPTGPSNQFTRPDGTVVQNVRRNGYVYVYDQHGKLLQKRRAA